MSILDLLTNFYAPFACLGCGVEKNRLICEGCSETVVTVPSHCYRCHATTRGFEVCRRCRASTPLRQVVAFAEYDGLVKALLHHAKYERARCAIKEMAAFLSPHMQFFGSDIVLVPVPTATSRARQRGYDQAIDLAQHLSRSTRVPFEHILRRLGQHHQVGTKRLERIAHLQNAFRVTANAPVKGRHFVLVDDVCTTGATLESAARTLKQAGAKRVDAVVFAQTM